MIIAKKMMNVLFGTLKTMLVKYKSVAETYLEDAYNDFKNNAC